MDCDDDVLVGVADVAEEAVLVGAFLREVDGPGALSRVEAAGNGLFRFFFGVQVGDKDTSEPRSKACWMPTLTIERALPVAIAESIAPWRT